MIYEKSMLIQKSGMISKLMEIHWSELKCYMNMVIIKYNPLNASHHGIGTVLFPLVDKIIYHIFLRKDGSDQSVALEAGILASSGNRLGWSGWDWGISASSSPGSAPGSASSCGIHRAALRFWEVMMTLNKVWPPEFISEYNLQYEKNVGITVFFGCSQSRNVILTYFYSFPTWRMK